MWANVNGVEEGGVGVTRSWVSGVASCAFVTEALSPSLSLSCGQKSPFDLSCQHGNGNANAVADQFQSPKSLRYCAT